MRRNPARVRQADIARALRALAASGMKMRVEILPDGKIVMEPLEGAERGQVEYKGKIRL